MTKEENMLMQIRLFNEAYPKLAKKTVLNQESASKFLGCSPSTMRGYRKQGVGPSYSIADEEENTRPMYTKIALAEWLIDSQIKTA